jgi:hypothetical protein
MGARVQARAANCNVAALTGIVSAGEFGVGLRKVIKTSQIHGLCMHFRVRVLYASALDPIWPDHDPVTLLLRLLH